MKKQDDFFVYALWSLSLEKIYVGFTQDPDQRLQDHNSGKSNWTKRGKGTWKRFYLKQFEEKEEALKHEKYLKSGWGRKALKKELKVWLHRLEN